MSRVNLPSGAWIELGDPKAVTERSRRPIRTAMMRLSVGLRVLMETTEVTADDIDADDMAVMADINDLCAVAIITSASFNADRVTVDDLLDLTTADYDAVVGAIGPLVPEIMTGTNFDPTPDPDSPTVPSSD